MELRPLAVEDRKLVEGFLALRERRLAAYGFANIYVWKNLFDVRWALLNDNLCIFFSDRTGCFLYLPPLGSRLGPAAAEAAFGIMDRANRNRSVSRIENVGVEEIDSFRAAGYGITDKDGDYLCRREEIAVLAGNRFRHQRAARNHFVRYYRYEYSPFTFGRSRECLELYDRWQEERRAHHPEPEYGAMLGHGRLCLETLLAGYGDLGVEGRIVTVDGAVKGFTFGCRLDQDTFCVIFEVTDLSVKGLSPFIFSELCRELTGYRWVNVMDDSGLESLKRVKLSWRPEKLVPAYIVKQKDIVQE